MSIHEKIKTWLVPKKSKIGLELSHFDKVLSDIDFSPVTKYFSVQTNTLDYEFEKSIISAGAVCFIGSLFMSLTQLGYIRNIDQLFTLASCYMLLDHYIDNPSIPSVKKKETIKEIKHFLDSFGYSDNPIVKVVSNRVISMISSVPSSKQYLDNLFKIEIESMKLQQQKDLSREEYLELCEKKGGLTCEAIQSLLELEVTEGEYELGACIQLVDDLMDLDDDISLGINTIFSHDLHHYKILDKIIIYTVNKIDKLGSKYNFFKVPLYLGLCFGVHINRSRISSELLNQFEPFIYSETITKDELLDWFGSKF